MQPVEKVKSEGSEITTEDLPTLAGKDELRNLGYMPDDQNLLFGKAVPTVRSSMNAHSDFY